MLKTFSQIFTVLSCICFILSSPACTPQSLSKEDLIERCENLLKENQPQLALDLLTTQGNSYLDDSDLLFLSAQSHQQLNDPFTASAILLSAVEANPENAQLLDAYFIALKAAEMDTDGILTQVAEQSPGSLNQEEWLRVSQLYEASDDINAAIKAHYRYLGSDKAQKTTPVASATILSQYYLRQGEVEASVPWLKIVAESDSIEALPAQLKLLSLELNNKRWKALEARISMIEARFPGALEGSSFSDLPKIVSDKLAERSAISTNEQAIAGGHSNQTNKTGGIQDIDDLEAFANRIAVPISAPSDSQTESVTDLAPDTVLSLAEFNPEVLIEPADPFLDVPSQDISSSSLLTSRPPLSQAEIDSMIEAANRAVLSNELETATHLYRSILENSDNRPVIWNQLAQVYLANGEFSSAENAALEAIRKAPNNIAYTLNYLKIAKKTKSEIRFLSELSTAAKQFPNSPEIALSLARAYDRNSRYKFRAKEYYIKFITLDPNHPQRAEAETAISRLP